MHLPCRLPISRAGPILAFRNTAPIVTASKHASTPGRSVANAIFISYRRDDTEGEAGRLFDDLTRAFGNDGVFMDVAGIRPGADFRHVIDDSVAHCGVLLAVIGPNWLTIAGADGQPRIDDASDFVALEIASALKREVPVIPVLVHGAHMPPPAQLPDSLKDLSFRNSVEISHARWNSDVQLLVEALSSYVAANPATAPQPVHATIPVQLPAPHPAPAATAAEGSRSKLPLILSAAGACVVAVILLFVFPGRSSNQPKGAGQAPSSASQPAQTVAGAATGLSAFSGQWKDPNPRGGNSLGTLDISVSGNQISIHARGTCADQSCDWGTQAASFDGTTASANYTLTSPQGEARTAQISVRLDGGNLDVDVANTFTDTSGSRQNQVRRVFQPGS